MAAMPSPLYATLPLPATVVITGDVTASREAEPAAQQTMTPAPRIEACRAPLEGRRFPGRALIRAYYRDPDAESTSKPVSGPSAPDQRGTNPDSQVTVNSINVLQQVITSLSLGLSGCMLRI